MPAKFVQLMRDALIAYHNKQAALGSQVQQAKANDVPYSHVAAPIIFSKPDWMTAHPLPPVDFQSYPNTPPSLPEMAPLPSLDYGVIRYTPWMDYQANFGLPENNGMRGLGGLRLVGLSAKPENEVK